MARVSKRAIQCLKARDFVQWGVQHGQAAGEVKPATARLLNTSPVQQAHFQM